VTSVTGLLSASFDEADDEVEMQRSTVIGSLLVGSLGLAGCASDMTEPVARPALQPTDASRTVAFATSSNHFTFAVTACNNETVLVDDRQTIFTFYADHNGSSLGVVAQTDMLSGVGQTTKAKYGGTFINANASLITPGLSAFTTVTDSALVTSARGLPNTYVELVTLFAMDKNGKPVASNVIAKASCTPIKAPHPDDDQ
jgi:hypothetical protein